MFKNQFAFCFCLASKLVKGTADRLAPSQEDFVLSDSGLIRR